MIQSLGRTSDLKVIEKVQAKERTKVEARALHPKVKTALLKVNRFVLSLMILKRDAMQGGASMNMFAPSVFNVILDINAQDVEIKLTQQLIPQVPGAAMTKQF